MASRLSRLGLLALLCSCAGVDDPATRPATTASAPAPAVEDAPEISGGVPFAGALTGGGLRNHPITLREGQYVQVRLDKGDLLLRAELFGPDGTRLREVVGKRYGPLQLIFIARKPGPHLIRITSLEEQTVAGRYGLTLKESRDATAQDAAGEAAAVVYDEAEGLRAEWQEDSLRRAALKYEEASERWRAVARMTDAAAAAAAAGDVYYTLSEGRKALEFYSSALKISRGAGDSAGELRALGDIGYAHLYLGENEDAARYFRLVLDSPAARGVQAQGVQARALNNVGEVEYSLGRLKESLKHLHEALATWEQAADRDGRALAHLNLGYAYSDSGELTEASEHLRQALSLARAVDDHRIEAQALTASGRVHSFLGEQQQALDCHRNALSLFRRMGDRKGVGVALNSVGQVYEDMNEPRTALDNYLTALEHYRQGGNRDAEAVTTYYIGRVYRALGDDERALNSYGQSIALSRQMGKRRVESYGLIDVGTILGLRGERGEALERFNAVIRLYRRISDRRGQAYVLNSIGYIHYVSGNYRRALSYYREALPLSRAAGDRNHEALTLYNIALAEQRLGLIERSLSDVEESLHITESVRLKVTNQELRTSYFASARDRYDLYIDLLMQLDKLRSGEGFAAAALQASERARARSLLDTLAEARVNIRQGVDPQLLEREQTLKHLLAAKTEYRMRLLGGSFLPPEAREVETEIRRLTTEYQDVLARIRERSPLYATLTQPQPLNCHAIQAELRDENTLLLEFALGRERSYLWAVTANSIESYELPGRSEVEGVARAVYAALAARQPGSGESGEDYQKRVEAADEEYRRQAPRLSEMLLGKLNNRDDFTRLLIIADGALQYIPFEALPDPDGHAPPDGEGVPAPLSPLLLRHEIVNLPSASTLALLRRRQVGAPSDNDKVVAVLADPVFDRDDPRVQTETARQAEGAGAPGTFESSIGDANAPSFNGRLPFTLEEARTISAVAPRGAVRVVTGFEANREWVVGGGLGGSRILHFATHGLIDTQHPELSGVMLSRVNERGQPIRGLLQLHDLYNLELSAQLTTLSACSTALGPSLEGEGLVGLTSGFMYAGSKSVVASLWKVDDKATAVLMRHFYESMLKDGMLPAAALRRAKVRMWQQRRWQSPYFWAAFVYQGEYREAIVLSPAPRWVPAKVAALALLAPALLAVALFFLRRRSAALALHE